MPMNGFANCNSLDLCDNAIMDPLAEAMVRYGIGLYLKVLGRDGAQWVSGLHLTPPRSGTGGEMPSAPGKQGNGEFHYSPFHLRGVRRKLSY